MTEDGEKDRNEGQKRPSRPATAAARREQRRASARSTAKPAGKPKASENRAASGKPVEGAEGKTAGSNGDDRKGRPTPTREKGDKRPSLFARIARFLREVVGELRKVIWPTRKQMITYTIVVLIFVAFMVSLVAGLDLALNNAVLWLFG